MRLFVALLVFLLAPLSPTAQAQSEIRYQISYESASRTHRVCGTPENTNSLIRLQDIGEIEARATLHWKTTTPEAVAVQVDEVEGLGRSPVWDKFYNSSLSKNERVEILKDAILGVGDATALHVYPYFFGQGVKKARTWKDFSARIREAGSEIEYRTCQQGEGGRCIRASSWVPKVLNQYAAENRSNLGYTRDQITGLRTITRTEEFSRPAPERNRRLRYAIQFIGFKLLPGECDAVTISYDERGIGGKMETSINSAAATHVSERAPGGRDALILVTAQGRRNIGAPRGLARLTHRGESVIIEKSETLTAYGFNREFVSDCRLEAKVSVAAVENTSWYDWGGKSRLLANRTFAVSPLASNQTESLGALAYQSEKESLRVESSFSFAPGCPFFNPRPF